MSDAVSRLTEVLRRNGMVPTLDPGRNITHHCTFCDTHSRDGFKLRTIGRYPNGEKLTRPVCPECDELAESYERGLAQKKLLEGLPLPPDVVEKLSELERLRALVNAPQVDDFLEAVRLEAAHQVERWGSQHDAGKAPADWFWLLGWLSGKAVHAAIAGDVDKARHHTISSAAVLLNWHAQLSGKARGMRPGIEPPDGGSDA